MQNRPTQECSAYRIIGLVHAWCSHMLDAYTPISVCFPIGQRRPLFRTRSLPNIRIYCFVWCC